MTIIPTQKASISSVFDALLSAVAPPPSKQAKGDTGIGGHGAGSGRGRRRNLSGMFLVLLDRNDWAEYYEIIPNPRALNPIKETLAQNKYTDALEVYTDLSLVFWNAMFYNERDSQVYKDAVVLKNLLEFEWAKHTDLPQPRSQSPPPGSAQRVFPEVDNEAREKEKERELERQREEKEKEEMNAKTIEPSPPQAPQPVQAQNDVEIIDVEGSPSEFSETESEFEDQTEVDIDSPVEDNSLDIDNDTVVRHLDKSLPRWPGFDENELTGWLAEGNTELYSALVHAIKGHKDVIGNRPATALESIPDAIDGPTGTTKEKSISFKTIEARIKSNPYSTPTSFDKDMMLLFEKGRRWWEPTPTNSFTPSGKSGGGSRAEYAKVLILQRLYQALTSPHLPDRLPLGSPCSSETNFASLSSGPGKIVDDPRINPAVASGSKHIDTITKNRAFVDEIKYKGWTIRVGDWVHLANGSDAIGSEQGGGAGRPIVAQVWKLWCKMTEANGDPGQYGITVCWYYRPQETFHSSQRVFWENEVFKSNHFSSHPLPDIIEPIFVQPTRDHIRGRPRAVEGRGWYPGWPLYVCDSRYSYSKGHKAHKKHLKSIAATPGVAVGSSLSQPAFVRVKNWDSCIPPEVSGSQFQRPFFSRSRYLIYPFERIAFPKRRASPFLDGSGGGAPGGLIQDGGLSGRGPTKGVLVGSDGTKISGSQLQQYAHMQQSSQSGSSYQQYNQNQTQYSSQVPVAATATATALLKPSKPERTTTVRAISQGSQYELSRLPEETTRHFSRDPSTGSLLWFPSPPVNAPGRSLGTSRHNGGSAGGVGYSLSYLHWRAMKMKAESVSLGAEHGKAGGEGILGKRKAQGDGDDMIGPEGARKIQKNSRTTVLETLSGVLKNL